MQRSTKPENINMERVKGLRFASAKVLQWRSLLAGVLIRIDAGCEHFPTYIDEAGFRFISLNPLIFAEYIVDQFVSRLPQSTVNDHTKRVCPSEA
jgi:hypothetical protein